jgi:acetoacetyl-CoA reductase
MGAVKMEKKVALVTGAMGGLGTAICKAFAKDGYKRGCRNITRAIPTTRTQWLKANGSRRFQGLHLRIGFDVSDYEQCKAAVEAIATEVGPASTSW